VALMDYNYYDTVIASNYILACIGSLIPKLHSSHATQSLIPIIQTSKVNTILGNTIVSQSPIQIGHNCYVWV
jgi:hypothetical protein